MLYVLFRALLRVMFTVFYRYQVIGAEHVPKDGAAIICPNHISNFDPPLVGSGVDPQVHFMAKDVLFRIPIIGFLVRSFGAFPVDRKSGGRRALKMAMQALKDGKLVGIFLEGTRSKTGKLGKSKSGAASLAVKLKVPIIPTAVIGPYRLFRRVRIVYGKSINPHEFEQEANPVNAMTDRTTADIQRMLDQYAS